MMMMMMMMENSYAVSVRAINDNETDNTKAVSIISFNMTACKKHLSFMTSKASDAEDDKAYFMGQKAVQVQ